VNEGPFRRPAVLLLLGGTALSLLCWLLMIVFGDRISESPTIQPSAYSWSAIGHRAFVALLRDRGVPVVVSRHDSATRAGMDGLLLLLEPREGHAGRLRLHECRRVLMVLPKWEGGIDPGDPDWIGAATRVPAERIGDALRLLDLDGEVLGAEEEAGWETGRLGIEPTLDAPQLLSGSGLDPLVRSGAGVLLGRARGRGRTIHLLTDPDLLSNHGLGRGRNAELALRIVEEARAGGTVYVDETCHGFASEPTLWSELFRPPLLFAMAQAFAAALLLIASGARRFGAPAPRPPPLSPGKSFLIGNTAALLRFGGHAHHAVDRYYRNAVQEAARHLNPPPGLDARETERWLLGSAEGRGLLPRTREMEAGLERVRKSGRRRPLFVLGAARRIHRWKQEMVHGPRHDS
jgi:hypothetical protein